MKPTQVLASFCANLCYADLPDRVVDHAKMAVLDTLGCALGTHAEDPERVRIILQVARHLGAQGDAGVIHSGLRTSAPVAALANGVACHGIDFDDLHAGALTHTSCVILPAALASAEEADGSGRDFITSFVLGFEIAVRVGMAVMPSHYEHWHSTATNGTFGAAAAAGKNYGLDAGQHVNALGFSGTQAAGLLAYLEFGDYTKSLNPGKSAFNGVLSALLARAGATAPPDMLENPKGYASAYSAAPRMQELLRGLDGGPMAWEILNNMPKPFPSLSASHTAMEATLRLVADHGLRPADIRRIVVYTYDTVVSHFSGRRIDNPMAARLSVPYCVAVCAALRRAGLEAFRPDVIRSAAVQAMLEKVEIVAEPRLNALYPGALAARVEIATVGGQVHEHEIHHAKGSPGNPFSMNEMQEKFERLAAPTIGAEQAARIVAMVEGLEHVGRIRDFSHLFA
ncbi:MmgE/PrpD family protein [Candidimonas nitroreducens]|nr:MmgE/PrpD family protein [Candidimonas nitroreducens]